MVLENKLGVTDSAELARMEERISKAKALDIRDVKIDVSKSREERISDYIRQVKNPYCFQCNGIIVKMNFCQLEETLEDKLAGYFLSV